MTTEQRLAVFDQIAALPTDEARMRAYFEFAEIERIARTSVVVMCRCADWQTCEHPWPMRMR